MHFSIAFKAADASYRLTAHKLFGKINHRINIMKNGMTTHLINLILKIDIDLNTNLKLDLSEKRFFSVYVAELIIQFSFPLLCEYLVCGHT